MLCHDALLLILLAPLALLSAVEAAYVPRHKTIRSQRAFRAAQDKLIQEEGVTFADSYHGKRLLEMSKAERWSLVTSLKSLTENVKTLDKNTESYHAHRWNLPHYKRLHNCVLASLSEIDEYSGILLYGKTPRDHVQKDKGFSTCSDAELDIVIGVGSPFTDVVDGNSEAVWASSTVETYDRLDHTFLYASSLLDATRLYERFPSLVKIVLAEAEDLQGCVSYNAAGKEQLLTDDDIVLGAKVVGYQYDSLTTEHSTRLSRRELDENARDPFAQDLRDDYHIRPYGYKSLSPVTASHDAKDLPATCVRRTGSESGIPIWKLFEWQPKDAVSAHPLGHQFTVSPYQTAGSSRMSSASNIHLGLSLEGRCGKSLPEKKRYKQIYLASEDIDELEEVKALYQSTMWDRLAGDFDVEFVASAGLGGNEGGINNLGNMGKRATEGEIRQSKVYVDLRPRPLDHQSLYEALCKGLPAVYLKSSVTGTPLADLTSPYAYPIAGDSESLKEALRSALKNPIKSYLAPSVSQAANDTRHELLITTAWNEIVKRDADLRSIMAAEGFDI